MSDLQATINNTFGLSRGLRLNRKMKAMIHSSLVVLAMPVAMPEQFHVFTWKVNYRKRMRPTETTPETIPVIVSTVITEDETSVLKTRISFSLASADLTRVGTIH